MYLINAYVKKIRNIMMFLKSKGVEFEETKSTEYLVVRENPKDILPVFLLSGTRIIEAPVKDAVRMYKNYGSITELLHKKKPLPEEGQVVRIIGGDYKDLSLSGKVVSVGQKSCTVEVLAWGNLIKLNVSFDDVEVVQHKYTNFRNLETLGRT